jgi:hypothetical protein
VALLLGVALALPAAPVAGASRAYPEIASGGLASIGVPSPTVVGPIASVAPGDPSRNYPWAATNLDLAAAGYVEEEFFFDGQARRFVGEAFVEGEYPYRSRMLVRRPLDDDAFNGVVIVEWYNVTDQRDGDYDWLMLSDHILRSDYARALGLASPLAAAGESIPVDPRDVRRRDLLGGLIHEYHGAAA